MESAEDLIKNYVYMPIIKPGDPAYAPAYVPTTKGYTTIGYITMPSPNEFDSTEHYYAALFHEMAHSAQHRNKPEFRHEEHSVNELIAEITACYLCEYTGIRIDFENSQAYINGWAEAFENDYRLIFTALRNAKKVFDFIIENSKIMEEAA